jgi:hypothetical protein
MEFSEAAPVLNALAIAESSDEPLDVGAIAEELDISEADLRERVDQIETLGSRSQGWRKAYIRSS